MNRQLHKSYPATPCSIDRRGGTLLPHVLISAKFLWEASPAWPNPGFGTACSLIAAFMLLPIVAGARTFEMTDLDTVMMAAIHEDFPLSSWAGWKSETGLEYGTGEYTAGTHAATLVQFPLGRIPEGQQIVNAELIIPVHYDNQYPDGVRLYVWRLLG
jgi:hypothetical protein